MDTVPDLLIEQYALGELDPETALRVERSPGFAERLTAIEESNREILARYPAEHYVPRILNQHAAEAAAADAAAAETTAPSAARRRSPRAPALRWVAVALPAAAALVAAILIGLPGRGPLPGALADAGDTVRLKGAEPTLAVYRAAPDGSAERLTDGATARAGDTLQVTYQAADSSYGIIVSIDGRGVVTLHYPLQAASGPRLTPGGEQVLPRAYVLDDAPSFERFYLITSDRPFAVGELVHQIRVNTSRAPAGDEPALGLPDGYRVTAVTVRKGE